ncbi:MAG: GNAT family N-acetyltransferase [Sedimenticolaceae bacterium]|nr:GNAT family N-acetyltransferase [Chromatiaceae bacterium]MCP5439544.1 GNAT family N-acetyltransferase [Chromatiaceae bacterium]HPE81891.1 GNAT family N-acetyltransferase [Gammaproteobacteria bacterium]
MAVQIAPVDWQLQQRQLLGVRIAVFVDEQGVPAELEHDRHDARAIHLLATVDDGTPVATARLLPDGHIGRMAVLKNWRGQGIGTAMLRALIGIARQKGQDSVFLHAQCRAEGFYARMGFRGEGDVFDDAGIEHRRMILPLTQDTD